MKNKHISWFLVILILIILHAIWSYISDSRQTKQSDLQTNYNAQQPQSWNPTQSSDNKKSQKTDNYQSTYNIEINALSPYSGLSKKEIYNIRKHYVSKSIFARQNYEPDNEVFGAIVDGKPWYGIDSSVCFYEEQNIENKTKGPSSVSKFMNNPSMLIGIMIPYVFNKPFDICTDESIKFIPVSMTYEQKEKRITAVYVMSKQTPLYKYNNEQNGYYTLITLNARDFGYQYGYISDLSNIKMNETNSMANHVTPFSNFVHLGYSCGLQGGCNNVSPRTTDAEFQIRALPAQMDLKLWKKQPFSSETKSDINYRMIFKTI